MTQLQLFTPVKPGRDTADITVRKHGGDSESTAARTHVNVAHDRKLVLDLIDRAALTGMTLDAVAEKLGRPVNCLSGRITELKRDGLIVAAGWKRPTRTGCDAKVYVTQRWSDYRKERFTV